MSVLLLLVLVRLDILTALVANFGALSVTGMLIPVRLSAPRRKGLMIWLYFSLILVASLISVVFRVSLMCALGGERFGFNGREPIWFLYLQAYLWRPIIGTGWGTTPGWPPTDPDHLAPAKEYFLAHNGFLDIGLALGAVGLVLMVAALVALFIVGTKLAVDQKNTSAYLFIPALITYLVLNDLMATSLPRFIGLFLVGVMVGMIFKPPEPRARGTIRQKILSRQELPDLENS